MGSRGSETAMPSSAVPIQRLESIPVAVIQRQVRASELSRVVPEGCGLVWNAVRAHHTKDGRHVAISLDGSIRLAVGVKLQGPCADEGSVVHSATPAGPVAWSTHLGPYQQL